MSVTVHFPLPTARLCRRDSIRLVSLFHNLFSFVICTPDKRAEWNREPSQILLRARNSDLPNSKHDLLHCTLSKLLVIGMNCGIFIEKLHYCKRVGCVVNDRMAFL
jgi:hypothetical protein